MANEQKQMETLDVIFSTIGIVFFSLVFWNMVVVTPKIEQLESDIDALLIVLVENNVIVLKEWKREELGIEN